MSVFVVPGGVEERPVITTADGSNPPKGILTGDQSIFPNMLLIDDMCWLDIVV